MTEPAYTDAEATLWLEAHLGHEWSNVEVTIERADLGWRIRASAYRVDHGHVRFIRELRDHQLARSLDVEETWTQALHAVGDDLFHFHAKRR